MLRRSPFFFKEIGVVFSSVYYSNFWATYAGIYCSLKRCILKSYVSSTMGLAIMDKAAGGTWLASLSDCRLSSCSSRQCHVQQLKPLD